MMTVKEVSHLSGVSIRTLQYYDKIGLLPASAYSQAGYRLYDGAALERLQQILLFRELEFPLKEIGRIMAAPDYDKRKALEQQIELLTLKREHLDDLITFARGMKLTGVDHMDFHAFDTKKLDEYAARAKETWGKTDAYKEFEEKSAGRTRTEEQDLGAGLMDLLAVFGTLKDKPAHAPEAQAQVKKLQDYISEHYYTCTDAILFQLGQMYTGGGTFTENINKAGGEGCAEFAARAIEVYCRK